MKKLSLKKRMAYMMYYGLEFQKPIIDCWKNFKISRRGVIKKNEIIFMLEDGGLFIFDIIDGKMKYRSNFFGDRKSIIELYKKINKDNGFIL